MVYLFAMTSIFFSMIDLLLIIYTIDYNSISIISAIIIHIIMVLLLLGMNKKLFNSSNKTYDMFYLKLFFPIIGFLIIGVINIFVSRKKDRNDLVESYESYVKYIKEIVERRQVDFRREIQTMSVIDELRYSSEERKKEAIVGLIDDEFDTKVEVLKKALLDSNPEVVHYAATTLNSIENKYEATISKLKEEYKRNNDYNILLDLLNIYKKYIDSGLLEDELLNIFLKEYLELLLQRMNRISDDKGLLLEIVSVQIKLGQYSEAMFIMRKLYDKFPANAAVFIQLMKLLYYMGKYNEVKRVAKKIRELEIVLSEEEENYVSYWL